MAQQSLIKEELEALNSIHDLAESYEEIAVTKMQKIKDSVLRTRTFLAGLSDVFIDLKSSYEKEVEELIKKKKAGDKSLIRELHKNGKTLYVYLASTGKLYGAVTQKTFRLFYKDLKAVDQSTTDVVILGRAGKEMYEGAGVKVPFEFIDIPDSNVDLEHIKKAMRKFMLYEKVHVYYGKFDNVVQQTPITTSISGEEVFETEVKGDVKREDKFIFEPVLEKIFHYFETEIMANLFSQTLLENELARHASRVNAMEEALVHIDEERKKFNRLKTRVRHLQQNKKQLETISGVILWED